MKKVMLGLLFLSIFGVGAFFGINSSKSSVNVNTAILGPNNIENTKVDKEENIEEKENMNEETDKESLDKEESNVDDTKGLEDNDSKNENKNENEEEQVFRDEIKSKKNEYLESLNRLEIELESSLKEKYDSGVTVDMIEALSTECDRWDSMLNDIYTYLSKILNKEDFNILKDKQIDWIKLRDDKSKESGMEFEGGSLATVNELSSIRDTTKDRCYELVDLYIK